MSPADHPPIAFPDADWAWFLERCTALEIADAAERRAPLEALYGHLVGVNGWLNLTRITTPRDYLKLHVLDSLTLEGDTRLKHLSEGAPCVDLGSGGGYPGLPMALWHQRVPWVLVDSRRKKAEFLTYAAGLTGNPRCIGRHLVGSEARHAAPELFRTCQLVVSRAMGQAVDVLAEAEPLLAHHGHCIIMKGPAFAGAERETAMGACRRLGFRYVSERRVTLEAGDGERVMAVFERE